MGAFIQDPVIIRLGNLDVEVKEMPLARLNEFKKLWSRLFQRINEVQANMAVTAENEETIEAGQVFDQFLDIALEMPYELMSIAVKDLPKEPFEDPDDGVTVPQLLDAFDVVLKVNKLEVLKKLTPFFQNTILSIDPALERMRAIEKTA